MRKITLFLAVAATCCFMSGCKKDGGGTTPAPKTDTEKANEWVYSTMKTNYLWSDKLPSKDESGLSTPTQTYFDVNLRYRANKSVVYSDDTYGDRFSKIAKIDGFRSAVKMAETEMDYDFGFVPVTLTSGGVPVFMQVLYVIPGSPAETAGLERGDAFKQISGQNLVSKENIAALLKQPQISLKILNRTDTPTINITKEFYYDNPVLFDDVLEISGQNIGYLFYTHFTSGDATGEGSYLTKLKDVFKKFKDKGVTKLILDLRYNGGGEVANAQWLASLIIPSAKLGGTWMYMERNSHNGDKNKFQPVLFMTASEVGTKADIEDLFVITSENTASASELIIHTLRPYYGNNLRVIGLTTKGKNVGSVEYKNETLGWVMNPITIRVYDKDKMSGYEKGIKPDVEMKEYWVSSTSPYPNYYTLAPIGDMHHEWLLNKLVYEYFTEKAMAPVYYGVSRSAGQEFEVTAGIKERGLTEPPQRVP